MPEIAPRCPDCDVTMEEMTLTAGGHYIRFKSEENREGILGKLGVSQSYDGQTFVCPECGLSRLYAEIDDS